MPDPGLRALQDYAAEWGGRLYLGVVPGGLALAGPQQALLVLGPPRSGKTTALAVPNLLAAPGAAVATSTKGDLLQGTIVSRSEQGRCWWFDPSGATPVPPGARQLRWSPAASSGDWDGALAMARSLARTSRPAGQLGESAHWTERAEALLAPLLHAAACTGGDMGLVVRWVLRQDLSTPAAVLAGHGAAVAGDILAGLAATDPREQSGILSSAAGVLASYRSPSALALAEEPNFVPRSLVGTRDTVYIGAPARQQQLVAPVVVAFLEEVRAGVYAGTGRLPVTFVLDELANIAPLPDLPAMVAEGGGQGLLTVGFLQDLSQARQRWGAAADGLLSLFGAKVVLPGIADLGTLELVSRLGGEVDVPVRSVSRSPWWSAGRGAPTTTWATRRQRRLPVDAVSQQPLGSALTLVGRDPPAVVSLPPWWATPPFASAARQAGPYGLGADAVGAAGGGRRAEAGEPSCRVTR